MAINIQQKFSIDLSGVVENSITAVKAVRRSEQTRKEAEFQRAIANGLSYEEQIKMREQQLREAKEDGFSDDEYVLSLEKFITDTKKLNRFNKYRTKYTTTFAELVAGRINEQRYLDVLKNQLGGVQDFELLLEIQRNVASAEEGLKAYNDTILSNKVKLAKYDGSVKTLSSMVAQVTIARADAAINDKQDEVTAYDETLAALNSQLSSIRIEDATLDFQAKSETRGTNSLEKLDFMNSQILSADPDSPVRIADSNGGARTYSSAQQFWTITRDNYLSSDFFKELDTDIKINVAANTKVAGISQATIDNTAKIFNDLRVRPEFAPFIQRLEAVQNITISNLAGQFSKRWIDVAGVTGDFSQASQQIANVGKRYGVDMTSFVETLSSKAASLVERGEEAVAKEQPPFEGEVIEPAVLGTPPPVVITPPAPALTPAPTPAPASAPQAELPQFIPATGVGAKSGDGQFTFTAEGWKPTASIPISTPATAPVPVTPTTPPTYTGSSIVDYLKSQKQDSSFENRRKLATEKGIVNYTGDEKQNLDLLKLLRG